MNMLNEVWTVGDAQSAMSELGWYLEHRDKLVRQAVRAGLSQAEVSRISTLSPSTVVRILRAKR